MKGLKINTLIKVLLSLGLGIYLTWYLFEIMTPKDILIFKNAILNSNYWLIGLSLLLALLSYFSRAYRWGYTLWPLGYKSSFKNQYHSLMIGYLVNMAIPRAGEFSRALMLKRSDNIPVGPGFGTIVTERIIDMLILGLLTLLAVRISPNETALIMARLKISFFGPTQNGSENNVWMYLFIVLGIVLILLLLFKNIRTRISHFLFSLKEGENSYHMFLM